MFYYAAKYLSERFNADESQRTNVIDFSTMVTHKVSTVPSHNSQSIV